jgi:hypothetical protein
MLILVVLTLLAGPLHAQGRQLDDNVRGRQVELRLRGGASSSVRGELLVVGRDSAWVLSGGQVVAMAMASVYSATVRRHGLTAKKGVLWGLVVGAGSGLGLTVACSSVDDSNGCGGVLPASALLGLAFGALGALSLDGSSRWRFEPVVADSLSRFARFPQGWPLGVQEVLAGRAPDSQRVP